MQSPEAEAFLQRLSTPGVTVPIAIQPSIDDELVLRRLFATKRTHSRLQNPHVGLVNVYGPGTDGIRHIRARVVEDAQDLDKRYLFPLSDDVRKKDGELAMAETFADFRTRWEIFTEGSLGALLDWNNIIAAGGSVLACLLPLPDEVVAKGSTRAIRKHYHTKAFPASDVDLFLYGLTPEEAEAKAISIYKAIQSTVPWQVTAVRTKYAISIHCQYPYRPVQIVLRLYQSPAEVLAGFDVDCACVAFDGQRVLASPRAITAMMTQSNQVALDRRSPSYEVRLAKYATRGFDVHVADLRREDFDPAIFDKQIYSLNGLARLLVLEKLYNPIHRQKYLKNRYNASLRPVKEPYRYQRNVIRPKGDLKVGPDEGELELSFYDTFFHIPYGPGINAKEIEMMVYAADMKMNATRSQESKGRSLHRHSAFFGTMVECMEDCCGNCPDPINEEEEKEAGKYVRGRITFLQDDPGKQSITGSFNPIDAAGWSEQAYVLPITKLFNAIALHDRPAVAKFIQTNSDITNPKTHDHLGRTPLQLAILCSAEDIAIDLINAGARITPRTVDGRNGLHLACQLGLERVVGRMLEVSERNKAEAEKNGTLEVKKPEVVEEEKPGITEEDVGMDQRLEREQTELSDEDPEWTADLDSMMDEDEDLMEDPEEGGAKDRTWNEKQAMQKLVPDGTPPLEDVGLDEPDVLDLNLQDKDQHLTALGYAIIYGSVPIIKLLVAAGADVKSPQPIPSDSPSMTPGSYHALQLTALIPDHQSALLVVETLVSRGASSNVTDTTGTSAFQYLVASNKVEIIEALLKIDPQVKLACQTISYIHNKTGPPIISAIMDCRRTMVALMLAYGECKSLITEEDFASGIPANALQINPYLSISNFQSLVHQPLEASIAEHSDLFNLFIELEPEQAKTFIPMEIPNFGAPMRQRTLLDYVNVAVSNMERAVATARGRVGALELQAAQKEKDAAALEAPSEEVPAAAQDTWQAVYQKFDKAVADQQKAAALAALRQPAHNAGTVTATPEDEELTILKKALQMLAYYQEVQKRLIALDAQTFDQSFPDEEYMFRADLPIVYRQQAYPYMQAVQSGPAMVYTKIGTYTRESVGDHGLYDELYDAVWNGDHDKMRALCLPSEEGTENATTLLQMGVQMHTRPSNPYETMYTPLFVALQARRWDTAKLVLDIVKEQNINAPQVTTGGPDDDAGGNRLKRVAMVYSEVTPYNMFYATICIPLGGTLIHTVYPLTKAIYEGDSEAYREVRKLADSMGIPCNDASYINDILGSGKSVILDEYIRCTGERISISELVESEYIRKIEDGAETTEGPKPYSGLTVHGKKKDYQWAPDGFPLLWRAAQLGSVEIIEYLGSPRPLAAYKHFIATNPTSKRAKLLNSVKDLEAQLPTLLGFSSNNFGESPVLAAVTPNCPREKQLATLEMLLAEAPKLVTQMINIPVKDQRLTPLLAVCASGGLPSVFDWLVFNGANVEAYDQRGWNILHLLAAYQEPSLELYRHVLTKLPANTLKMLMSQRSKGKRNTPLSIAVKSGSVVLVKHLVENYLDAIVPAFTLRDTNGSIPLHTATSKGPSSMVDLLVKYGPPKTLHMEDGSGSTPLELATLAHLTSALEAMRKSRNVQYPQLRGQTQTIDLNASPCYKGSDEADIKGLRRVVENLKAAETLRNKPELLEALSNYADLTEQKFAEWKASQRTEDTPELTKPASLLNETATQNTTETFNIISTAAAAAGDNHRFVIPLRDVQDFILCEVERAKDVKARRQGRPVLNGFESEDEGAQEKYYYSYFRLLYGVDWAQDDDHF